MELASLLRNCVVSKKHNDETVQCTKENQDTIEDKYFQKFLKEWKGVDPKEEEDETYKVIPKFYYKTVITQIPNEDEKMQHKLREESRALFLQRHSKRILNNSDLKRLWVILEQYHSTPTSLGDDRLMTYEDFKQAGKAVEPKCSIYFTATLFSKLQHGDPQGRIMISTLFSYIMRKVWLYQTRIGLSLYDVTGQGYLRESDIESYIIELLPTLPRLGGMEKSFQSFYICTAVRKFLFFLDPLKTGRVRIQDILTCNFLDDLLELRDDEIPKQEQDTNWFSAPSALKVYGEYLNLDKDHNGMLSIEELSGYGTGTLTDVFLQRVFQECLTYEGEMDYKTYLDFVLALENRQEPQSLHYLFKVLDINNQGYLDSFTLNFFFRAIHEQIVKNNQEPISFEDVKDEIFDMVKPADPYKITLEDILDCGQGDTMVSILIEVQGFWAYENREAVVVENTEESS